MKLIFVLWGSHGPASVKEESWIVKDSFYLSPDQTNTERVEQNLKIIIVHSFISCGARAVFP